jgi:hypothetical protein
MSRRNWVSWLLAVLPIALGLFWVVLALLPYGTMRAFTDSLMPDHNFNSLKSWNAGVFKVLFAASGLVFLGLAALTGLRRWNFVGTFFKQLWADARRFFAGLRPKKGELGILVAVLVIMMLAVIYRLEHIYSSLHHDEAYTYVAFARSLFAAIADYHLPNNHVFHSILVYFSTKIFGIQPWAVRLPAFTAGVLLVPAAYWLAKRLYDRWTALGAALLVAWFPPLIAYSNNARGYTILALFTLLTLALGDIVRKEKNLFVWGLISLLSALGLYTVPVMLFPFGVLFVWLFLENQVEGVAVSGQSNGPGPYRTKWEFIWHWLAAGLGAAVLTLLFYTPILVFTGPQELFANGYVAPLPWAELLETLSHRFAETWAEWTFRVPLTVLLLFAAGWTLSLLFHRRLSTTRVPLQLAALLWIIGLLILQRPDAWTKVWVFLQPLILIWAAAGILGLLQKVHLKLALGLSVAVIVFGLALFGGIWQAARIVPQLPGLWAARGDEENAVLFVQSQLQESDLIVVAPPDDAPVWYYSELHGIPSVRFDLRKLAFERALVLVDPVEGQTPASVVAECGPDQTVLDVESARLLETFGKIQVFEVPRK